MTAYKDRSREEPVSYTHLDVYKRQAKDLPNIFDRFYRTDSSRNSSKGGSGIGLSIVKKIIEDHGGKIWANSKLGAGTVMYFVLRKYQEVPIINE